MGSALVFQVSAVNAGKRVPVGRLAGCRSRRHSSGRGSRSSCTWGSSRYLAFFMPGMRGDDSEAIDRDRILLMQKLINAAQERDELERDTSGGQRG